MATRTSAIIQRLRKALQIQPRGTGETDGQLLGCFVASRDEAAFAALVLRHGPMVWGVCRRLLNHHDAEDAFQAAFLVLFRKAASIRRRELLANWLYGVAHQTAMQARRAASRRGIRERQVGIMVDQVAAEPDHGQELHRLLDQELSCLPARYRAVIVLCDLEGKTRREAARHLGVPEGTIAGRVARARAMLAKRLRRLGLVISGGALAVALTHKSASAAVPTSAMTGAIKAAALYSAGQVAAAGAISGHVTALAEGVLKTMLLRKLQIAAALLAAIVTLGSGAGLIYQARASEQRQGQPATERPQEPGADKAIGGQARNADALVAAPVPIPQPPDNTPSFDALRQASAVLDNVNENTPDVSRLWCTVADLHRKFEDPKGAVAALEKAKVVAEKLEDKGYNEWRQIGEGYAGLGDAKAVKEIAALVGAKQERTREIILQEAANAAAAAGHIREAEQIADKMTDAETRAWVQGWIRPKALILRAKSGDVAGAVKAVGDLPTAEEKVLALVGREHLGRGFDDTPSPLYAEGGIVEVQLAVGDKKGAKETALKAMALLPDVVEKRRALATVTVVRMLSRMDDVTSASKALEKLPAADPATVGKAPDRPRVLAELKAKSYLAAAKVRVGDDQAAEGLVSGFQLPEDQAYILQFVAVAQARAGRKAESTANFERAIVLVGTNPDAGSNLHCIAAAQALAGHFAAAAKTAANGAGWITWSSVAFFQAQGGDYRGAKAIADDHVGRAVRWPYADLCCGIAKVQARAGQVAAVKEWAEKEDDQLFKAYILVGLAEGLYREGGKVRLPR
jgi:RNA polymerase sigma factor (sigma-70 family)